MSMNVLAAALLIQSLPAPGAANWEPLGPPQDGTSDAIDPASIGRAGDRATFRMRSVRAAPDRDGITTAVSAFTIDCRAPTATLEGVDLYRADGSFDRSVEGDDPRPVGSDTMQRALFERVCRAAPAG